MTAIPIGVMKMVDQGEADDKIIAVHAHDPEYNHFRSIHDFPVHRMNEVKRFFEDYKILENKKVKVESFLGPEQAIKVIQEGLQGYRNKFKTRPEKRPDSARKKTRG